MNSDSESGSESVRSRSSRGSNRSYRSGILVMPVPRVKAMLKVHQYANRVSDNGAIFMTTVLEYITAEILEQSLNAARSDKKRRIKPKHVNRALKMDVDFAKSFKNITINEGGHVPLHASM